MAGDSFFAFGIGLATLNARDACIEVYYPEPQLQPEAGMVRAFFSAAQLAQGSACRMLNRAEAHKLTASSLLTELSESAALQDDKRRTELESGKESSRAKRVIATVIRDDGAVTSVAEAYLKLHLLSHRLVKPNAIDLNGIFKILPTVAWTSEGAIDGREINTRLHQTRLAGRELRIYALDKFPALLDYVVPSGVRIADTARVRLGAYLGAGTTIMPAGFINFNAGTVGPNMVEGRISQGVVLDAGSDLGGGASTMGILSGGNDTLIAVGRSCLIGANAGIGIALGDNCTVEAGLYVTAGAKVVVQAKGQRKTVRARELSGQDGMLLRRNSQHGYIECLPNSKKFSLRAELHG